MSKRRILLVAALSVVGIAGAGFTAYGVAAATGPGFTEDSSFSPVRPSGEHRRSPGERGDPLLSDEEAAAIDVTTDIVYRGVEGDELTLDVCRAPEADEPRAAILLIHGGGFSKGDKGAQRWQALCRWLADAGYVVINPNYRLAPEHPYPAAVEDLQAAVEWTRSNASTYGIDPDRIGAVGGSAGASLAQMLGAAGEGSTSEGARISSVVSLSGVSDLTESALELGEPQERQIEAVLGYLGCSDITDCPAAEAASPITHVDSTDPPFLLIHSQRERLPVEQTEAMSDALTDAGVTDSEVLILPGGGHSIALLRRPGVPAAVLAFLDRTLG